MRHGSLFSGIGGFDLAAEWMGWENVFHCEINEFGRKVLNYYWPESVSLADIHKAKFKRDERGDVWVRMDGIIADTENTRTRKNDRGLWERSCGVDGGEGTDKETRSEEDNTEYLNIGPVDIITGGFPCQPFSMAGKRKGTEDERHLWPEMLRVIREIQPRYVVGENVSGIVNWDGGVVFEQVHTDLESQGYEVQAYILPAAGVNAPHRRDRVWFVAHANGRSCYGGPEPGNRRTYRNWIFSQKWPTPDTGLQRQEIGQFDAMGTEQLCEKRDVANTCDTGLQRGKIRGITESRRSEPNKQFTGHFFSQWEQFPTQSPVRCGDDELSGIVVRNINPKIYEQISERYTDKDLQEVWNAIQSEDIQRKIRRLYKIHEQGILFQVLQLCSPTNTDEKGVSAFSEKASEKLLRRLRDYGTFANSPQGRKLEKQFTEQFADTLPYLSHEVALVAMEVERAAKAFNVWHRNESIKAYGNAIVPQVVYQIFKVIQQYEPQQILP